MASSREDASSRRLDLPRHPRRGLSKPPVRNDDVGAPESLDDLPTSVRWLSRIGTTLLPPATLAAIAYYFAVKRQQTLALYFGIDPSVLGFTTEDYLLRSGDALFLLALAGALVGLGAIHGHAAVTKILHDPARDVPVQRAINAAKSAGIVLLVVAVVSVFTRLPLSPGFLFPPFALGAGISLLAYGMHLTSARRKRLGGNRPETTGELWLHHVSVVLVAVVIFLSLFWGTKELASALGRGQAAALSQALAQRPGVILYTTSDIGLSGPGIDREAVPGPGAYKHRYEGLVLLVRSGDNYLLLPAQWTTESGTALVIRDDDQVRVEFTPHGDVR